MDGDCESARKSWTVGVLECNVDKAKRKLCFCVGKERHKSALGFSRPSLE